MLSAKGLVESRPKVRERNHWNRLDLDLLAWMFIANGDPAAARTATEALIRQAQLDTEAALSAVPRPPVDQRVAETR